MSKQLLVDVRPFEISRQQIDESIKENNGRLVVKGVLQRAAAKNQNGISYVDIIKNVIFSCQKLIFDRKWILKVEILQHLSGLPRVCVACRKKSMPSVNLF